MDDGVQVIIVTAVAAAALGTLLRPYFRKATASKPAAPCGNCAVSGAAPRKAEHAIRAPAAPPDPHA